MGDDRKVDTITHDELNTVINARESISVQEHYAAKLSVFFNFLLARKKIKENPATNLQVQKIKKDQTPPEVLNVHETKGLLNTTWSEAQQTNEYSVFASYVIMAFAGVRPEEICPREAGKLQLAWDTINFAERTITILGGAAKTRKTRVLSDLPDTIWKWLELIPVAERYGNVCKLSYSTMRRARKKLLPNKCSRILRHNFGTYAYKVIGIERAVEIMGHTGGYKSYVRNYKGVADIDTSFAYFAITPPTTKKEAEA